MPRRKAILILPKLKFSGGKFFVEYSYRNPTTGRMMRPREYKIFAGVIEKSEAKKIANPFIKDLTGKLNKGWTPMDEKKIIYEDEIESHAAASVYGRKKKTNKNVRYWASIYLQGNKTSKAPKTYETYRGKLRKLVFWCEAVGYGEIDISGINDKIMRDFFDFLKEKELDRPTIGKYRQIISSFFRHLLEVEKVIKVFPMDHITLPPKTKDHKPRPINKNNLDTLLNEIQPKDPQLFLACMFQYYLALRPGQELRLLKIKDIDTFNQNVSVNGPNAKTIARVVDMSSDLVGIVEAYQLEMYNPEYYVFGRNRTPGQVPVGKNTLRNRFNKFRDELGFPDIYKFYSLKHTGSGSLLRSGADIEELRIHLGHNTIVSTQKYIEKHFGARNSRILEKFPSPFLPKKEMND